MGKSSIHDKSAKTCEIVDAREDLEGEVKAFGWIFTKKLGTLLGQRRKKRGKEEARSPEPRIKATPRRRVKMAQPQRENDVNLKN